ncbi:hypothetical protein IQ06DRAFT_382103 [Phaeosphaeriaceae sp. SRC1lsM3a]|nr:hypothetical protein IQ06DRAFT_382103 [Stagonospora sp. SRC1lsM3a]
MDTSNHKLLGFFATQPPHIPSRIVTDNICTFGSNFRLWPVSARKELVHGPSVDIINNRNDIIGTAPKLLFTVTSPVFHAHFASFPHSAKSPSRTPTSPQPAWPSAQIGQSTWSRTHSGGCRGV